MDTAIKVDETHYLMFTNSLIDISMRRKSVSGKTIIMEQGHFIQLDELNNNVNKNKKYWV